MEVACGLQPFGGVRSLSAFDLHQSRKQQVASLIEDNHLSAFRRTMTKVPSYGYSIHGMECDGVLGIWSEIHPHPYLLSMYRILTLFSRNNK